ncbi:permease for cytosine/purines, uracil, thiamine, allantoin-domain-containing protein [Crepidotus variabilis]|uniref:Permease for cytosine/purines, uracil, thiamine, allantoin-domain-containing protein n=1 Tax=Crepidotus variabilis TaxID=179855 RepID=A0A9P6JPC6_9AGAR|nr:permease for cytosine/purines, uracil, thiamine, allantoin-domain-containing protein [Crepidotus variabilis]
MPSSSTGRSYGRLIHRHWAWRWDKLFCGRYNICFFDLRLSILQPLTFKGGTTASETCEERDIKHSVEETTSEKSEHPPNDQTQKADKKNQLGVCRRLTQYLLEHGVETHGITPTTEEQRTDTRIYQLFWLWFSTNFNILAFSTGTVGPTVFGLGLRSSIVMIIVVDVVTFIIPAYFAVFGPQLGARGMVQCRFSWGYYGSIIPSLLNAISYQGFLILNVIVGGQALAAVSNKIDVTVGIVIVSFISFVVTFCGYRVIHQFETFAWVPSAVAFPILLGLARKHLDPSTFPATPTPSVASILSFISLMGSANVSWCTITPDYGIFHDKTASKLKVFTYSYLGFLLPSLAWHLLGAAIAIAAPGVPSWSAGFDESTNIGGLLAAVIAPAGGFGVFLLVFTALGTVCACAPSMYTIGLSLMAASSLFAKIPRYVYTVISVAILIPLAILGAKRFYNTLVNVLGGIGYWSTSFASIVLAEHIIFRRSFSPRAYPMQNWDKAKYLPLGIPAIVSIICSFGVVILCMQQPFYTGPIAKAGTGEIGGAVSLLVSFVVYVPLRAIERSIWPARS